MLTKDQVNEIKWASEMVELKAIENYRAARELNEAKRKLANLLTSYQSKAEPKVLEERNILIPDELYGPGTV